MYIFFPALRWEPGLPGPLGWRGLFYLAPAMPVRGGEVPKEWRVCVGRLDMWPRLRLQRWNWWEGSPLSFRKTQYTSNCNSNTCLLIENLRKHKNREVSHNSCPESHSKLHQSVQSVKILLLKVKPVRGLYGRFASVRSWWSWLKCPA